MENQILVIEDIEEMSALIDLYLKNSGFSTVLAFTAEEAMDALKNGLKPELILLDLNLPKMSGTEFLKIYRKEISLSTPVIIVSARTSEDDIVDTLENGADEYITKPFSPKILIARIKAKLRTVKNIKESEEDIFRFGPYVLNMSTEILKKENQKIPLSHKEFQILKYLIDNTGKQLTPEKIYSAVWENQVGDLSTVGVYIQRIRKKIEENPAKPHYIKTEYGFGYSFCKDAQ